MSPPDVRDCPATSRYLAALPTGLLSYPECQIRGVYVRLLRERHAALWQQPDVPAALREALLGVRDDTAWMSLVQVSVAGLLARDRLFATDQAWLGMQRELADVMLQRPLLSLLAKLLSPPILLLGAGRHFATVHRGIVLRGRALAQCQHRLEIEHPPHLLPPLVLQAYAVSFGRALTRTGVADVSARVTETAPTRSAFLLSWQPPGR